MKVKWLGESSKLSLIHGKSYSVEAVDPKHGWYAIIDETGEEYVYPPEKFEIVEE